MQQIRRYSSLLKNNHIIMGKELLLLILSSLLLVQCKTYKEIVKGADIEIIENKDYSIGDVYESFIDGDYSKIYKSDIIILGLTKKDNFKKATIIYNYMVEVLVEEGEYEFRGDTLITRTERIYSSTYNRDLPIYNSYKYDNIKFQIIGKNEEMLLKLISQKELEKEYSEIKLEEEQLLKEFE